MGTTLSPKFAAGLASDVYLIQDEFSRRGFNLKYKDQFEMENSTMATGTTGAFIDLKKPHVMAFMTVGRGIYKNEAFVAIKGTASLYDALTDLNIGVRVCHNGCAVHQGFYYAFNSIFSELQQFINNLTEVSVVHCVGHSLGGAIVNNTRHPQIGHLMLTKNL